MKNIYDYYKFVNELRSNPELNTKADLTTVVDQFIKVYKDTPELLFVHFSEIKRPSFINKNYDFHSTPMAFYLYPLSNPENVFFDYIGTETKKTYEFLKLLPTKSNVDIIMNIIMSKDIYKDREEILVQRMFDMRITEEDYHNPSRRKDYIDVMRHKLLMSLKHKKSFDTFIEILKAYTGNKKHIPDLPFLDKYGIKYTQISTPKFGEFFDYFTHYQYVYTIKLKSLNGILIDGVTPKEELKKCKKSVEKSLRKNKWFEAMYKALEKDYNQGVIGTEQFEEATDLYDHKCNSLLQDLSKVENVKSLYQFVEGLSKECGFERRAIKMYKLFVDAGINGFLSYNDSYIDSTIPNQLALFNTSLIEDHSFYKNASQANVQ